MNSGIQQLRTLLHSCGYSCRCRGSVPIPTQGKHSHLCPGSHPHLANWCLFCSDWTMSFSSLQYHPRSYSHTAIPPIFKKIQAVFHLHIPTLLLWCTTILLDCVLHLLSHLILYHQSPRIGPLPQHTMQVAFVHITRDVTSLIKSNSTFPGFVLFDLSKALRRNELLFETLPSLSQWNHLFLIFLLAHSLFHVSVFCWIIPLHQILKWRAASMLRNLLFSLSSSLPGWPHPDYCLQNYPFADGSQTYISSNDLSQLSTWHLHSYV